MGRQPHTSGTNVLVACSGGTILGRAAHQAAVELHREGVGDMLCLARIGCSAEDMLIRLRNAARIVGIDGCPAACARTALELAGIPPTDHVIVTDLGSAQHCHDATPDLKAVARTKNAVRARLETVPGGPFCS